MFRPVYAARAFATAFCLIVRSQSVAANNPTSPVSSSFVSVSGTKILDESGKELFFNGINVGNWLVWEGKFGMICLCFAMLISCDRPITIVALLPQAI